MESSQSQPSILWRQVWGLSALLAALVFSWTIYGFYQPKILQSLGFVKLTAWLGIIQGFLGAIVEPLAGGISDRIQHRLGSRLPMITIGVSLAGLIFVIVALLVPQQLPSAILWTIPMLMTLWVISTIIFRGSALALLIQAAPLTAIPRANMILTFVFGLIGALAPILAVLIERMGASVTFVLGAIALVIGATILYSSTPQHKAFPLSGFAPSPVSPRLMALIFATGLGAGLEVNLLLRTLPKILQPQFSGLSANWLTSSILLISALAALPMGALTMRLGAQQAMISGLAAIVACLGMLLLQLGGFLVVILILASGIAFGLVFESQIPFALSRVAPTRAGLSTGLYFGGMGAATAFLSLFLLPPQHLEPTKAFLLGATAFLMATLSIIATQVKVRDRR